MLLSGLLENTSFLRVLNQYLGLPREAGLPHSQLLVRNTLVLFFFFSMYGFFCIKALAVRAHGCPCLNDTEHYCVNMEVSGHHFAVPPSSPQRTVGGEHSSTLTHFQSICVLFICKTGCLYFRGSLPRLSACCTQVRIHKPSSPFHCQWLCRIHFVGSQHPNCVSVGVLGLQCRALQGSDTM